MASPSVTLRPFETSDAADILVVFGDDQVTKFTVLNTFTTRDEALDYLKEIAIPHPWFRAICVEDRPIGCIVIRPNGDRRGVLGYMLASAYWGQGITTTAIKMTISTVFSELFPQLARVEALVDVENKGSQRVLEKAGFHKEAVLRKYLFLKGRTIDCVMYSLLSTD